MNIAQKQSILNWIEQIEQINLDEKLNERYPEEGDARKIIIGNYNAAQFIQLLQRVLLQLKTEINDGLGMILPHTHNFNNDYGKVNLENDLSNVFAWLSGADFISVASVLDSLIYYQVINGFWDKATKQKDKSAAEYEKLIRELEVVENKLKSYIDKNQELVNTFNQSSERLNTFIAAKTEEFNQLGANQQTSNTILQDIQNILADSRVKEADIKNIAANQIQTQTEIKTEFESQKSNFEEYKKSLAGLSTDLSTLITNTTSTLGTVSDKLDEFNKLDAYIKTKKEEIELLTGMAADGSLGSKFNQRQISLDSGLTFWKWAVPVMSVCTGVWIVIVFNYLLPHFTNEWLNILISILKTSPAFILLGFVFSQYKKERNLQEEYAFKSAVAMTLTAYSEMLAQSDDPKNTSRQQMLLKSIEMVYNQPQIYPAKSEPLFSSNSKNLKETIETLSEAVKNIKS